MQNQHKDKKRIINPIQIAYENNQIVALNDMIEFIVQNQNNFCFSFLFEDVLVNLVNKGIKVKNLLESDIFCHHFELDDWPVIHYNSDSLIVPFNGSKFQLKGSYNKVFGNLPIDQMGQNIEMIE